MSGVAVRPLVVGDLIRDNDPRMAGRDTFQVDAVSNDYATASNETGEYLYVSASRIHLDDKCRRSGWSRVTS